LTGVNYVLRFVLDKYIGLDEEKKREKKANKQKIYMLVVISLFVIIRINRRW